MIVILNILLLSTTLCVKNVFGELRGREAGHGYGSFWQITDIHWDMRYSEDGDSAKMCHTNKALSQQTKNGHYGDYKCDSPWSLVHESLDGMQKLQSQPDFILWTGDISPHVDDPQPPFDVIFKTLANVTLEIKERFKQSTLLPVLGNHDAFPANQYPDCNSEFYARYLDEGKWSEVMTKDQQEQFRYGGYYSYAVSSKIKVLALNTNLYYAFNPLGTNDPDPCHQFSWLKKQLEDARKQDSKVIISAHSPPGFFERYPVLPFFNSTYNDAYVALMAQHCDTIHSHVYGHLHTDSFRLFGGNDATCGSAAFLGPSVTPWQAPAAFLPAINPSLRLYAFDALSVTDYTQYHLNLTQVNMNPSPSPPEWQLYYRATEAYGLSRLDFSAMTSLTHSLGSNRSLFDEYYLRNSAGVDNGPCDDTCYQRQLCAIAHVDIQSLFTCTGYSYRELEGLILARFRRVDPSLYAGYFASDSWTVQNVLVYGGLFCIVLFFCLAVMVKVQLSRSRVKKSRLKYNIFE